MHSFVAVLYPSVLNKTEFTSVVKMKYIFVTIFSKNIIANVV